MYRQMLNAVDSRRGSGGIFGGAIQDDIPPGQAECSETLAACYAEVEALTDSAAALSAPMAAIKAELDGLTNELQRAQERGAGAADIGALQEKLDAIDTQRMDGVWCGEPGGRIPPGQAVLSEALHKAYRLVAGVLGREAKEA